MFSFVANHLWQSTLVAGGIGLLCLLLRNEGAHVRYWLWWVASVKFLLPFALLVQLGSLLPADSVLFVISGNWVNTTGLIATPVAASGLAPWLGMTLIVAWILGSTVYIFRWAMNANRIRMLLRRAKFERTITIGNRSIATYRSNDKQEPGIVGLFRPVLLLPERIDEVLSDKQLAAVAAHELCHVDRRDNLTAVPQMIVEAVLWFFPPVWFIGARLIAERERACDEAVIAQGHCRKSYAEGILNICEHFVKSPLANSAGVSGGNLSERVTHIMRSKAMFNLGVTKKILLATSASGMIVVPVLSGYAEQSAVDHTKDLWPVERTPPEYPREALEQKLNGYVDFEFTVTAQGTTDDIKVVSSTSLIFEESATRALEKFRYEPPGKAVPNTRIRIAFELTNDKNAPE